MEEEEEVTENSSSSVSDGCLNFDVAKRILATLEELPVYVSYVDANLRHIWSAESLSDFNKEASRETLASYLHFSPNG
jgi:hypothetical protein